MKRYLRYTTGLMLLGMLAFATMPAQAQEEYGSGIVVQVPEADAGALVMDGQANEEAWVTATEVNPTENWSDYRDTPTAPDNVVNTKLLWSQDTLYVYTSIQDYGFYFGPPGEPWAGDQILIGVDPTHNMDDQIDDSYAGWPEQAPDSLTVYKVTAPSQGGITSNWGYNGVFPVDEGWVNGTVLVDSTTFSWQMEMAIYVPQIEEDAAIGFNIGGAAASEERAAESEEGDGAYAYYAWSQQEDSGDAGASVHRQSSDYATLELVGTVAIEETPGTGVPSAFGLRANYPNPFRQSTTITYDMAQPGHVSLAVYDVLGRQVATLVDDRRAASSYNVRWTPESHVSNGIYFYQLRVDDELIATRRVTLLK